MRFGLYAWNSVYLYFHLLSQWAATLFLLFVLFDLFRREYLLFIRMVGDFKLKDFDLFVRIRDCVVLTLRAV